ncbi:hypothetical protein Ade02nite_69590 [Paractinoplanes deccanensis]|uniref:Uncharacterized protein n=1 Tax=Paractinoplanes deccanensis TaxID=113561 RepID=A0ABQ3YE91_9ACTN|nr:hypothetical protein [Actinoplanes deccanensis]GID78318.1 hypothetical protein Ade02nite_69590 [Actinoplanes deccanensis]
MNGHDDARWFLDQLRTATALKLGTAPAGTADPQLVRSLRDRLLRESISPAQRTDPEMIDAFARHSERMTTTTQDDSFSEMFTQMLTVLERTVAEQNPEVDLVPLRPLVGHLQTGHLNAVTMRVPVTSAHLVLVEDQMPLFANKLSKAFAWAVPREKESDGLHHFQFGADPVRARLDADPAIAERFGEIVLHYAVYGALGNTAHHLLPNGWFNFASLLRDGLEYFVLGHEYAHVLCNHLDGAESRRGVLPVEEVEAIAWSWRQELDADLLGTMMAINAMRAEGVDTTTAFMGVSLFFDTMDVLDRAVSLLLTGSEQSHQVGSHPPSALRKEHLAQQLAKGPLRDVLGVGEIVGEVVESLWQRARPQVLAMHRRGARPAPMWHTIAKETGRPSA